MFICELCGNTVAHVNHAEVCKSCASLTFTAVKQEVKKSVEDKDNQEFMLAFFGITLEQFNAVTHDNLSDIIVSDFASWYKNDAKRVLWHEYRANAFTKTGTLRKAIEKKLVAFIAAQAAAVEVAEVVAVAEVEVEVEVAEVAAVKVAASVAQEVAAVAINKPVAVKSAKPVTTAELLGAAKLTGSKKQKAWGEDIRTAFLSNLQSELALDMIVNSSITQSAKFWIETRNINRNKLEDALVDLVEATKRANEIGAGNDGYDAQLVIRSAALKTLNLTK